MSEFASSGCSVLRKSRDRLDNGMTGAPTPVILLKLLIGLVAMDAIRLFKKLLKARF